jgi:chloride channel 3/4/5
VAYLVDIAAATVSDWKLGHCTSNPLLTREACCASQTSEVVTSCPNFVPWGKEYTAEFGVYVAFALAFGLVSAGVTMLTKTALPSATTSEDEDGEKAAAAGKTMYMAAGSGIPEIKTILGGFVIPDFLSVKVLVVKAVGAVFAVSTGE